MAGVCGAPSGLAEHPDLKSQLIDNASPDEHEHEHEHKDEHFIDCSFDCRYPCKSTP